MTTQEREALQDTTRWTDERLTTRYTLLLMIENGWSELTDATNPFVRIAFPDGYDPVHHYDDNLNAVRKEVERRGVVLPQ